MPEPVLRGWTGVSQTEEGEGCSPGREIWSIKYNWPVLLFSETLPSSWLLFCAFSLRGLCHVSVFLQRMYFIFFSILFCLTNFKIILFTCPPNLLALWLEFPKMGKLTSRKTRKPLLILVCIDDWSLHLCLSLWKFLNLFKFWILVFVTWMLSLITYN